jgi:membrane associated rhomboid family serine protease
MMILLVILVLGGYALYTMNADERTQLKERIVTAAERARKDAERRRAEPEPFRDAIRERTPWPLVMPVLVAVNLLVFLGMGGGSSDHDALVSWGASFGPKTTNAEWWRLVSSMFVHGGFFQLLINLAALVQLGLVLERLVGHITFAGVYFASGILASLISLSDFPMATSFGASGALFGLYGLLLASVAWTALRQPRRSPASAEPEAGPVTTGMFGLRDLPNVESESVAAATRAEEPEPVENAGIMITAIAAKQLAPIAGLFLLYNLAGGTLEAGAELGGFAAGFISGVALTSTVSVRTPPVPRVAVAMAVALVAAVVSAVPLRGMADVRPEIVRVLEIEERTAKTYQAAMTQFQLGTVSAPALAQVIEKKITPEIEAMQARLKTLGRIPAEHQPLLTNAEEYLRLRDESWRIRAAALQKSSAPGLRKADSAERASLDALERLKPTAAAAQPAEPATEPPK